MVASLTNQPTAYASAMEWQHRALSKIGRLGCRDLHRRAPLLWPSFAEPIRLGSERFVGYRRHKPCEASPKCSRNRLDTSAPDGRPALGCRRHPRAAWLGAVAWSCAKGLYAGTLRARIAAAGLAGDVKSRRSAQMLRM
jgi:hypothetical protein